ncbi:hypothetical protein [uncultured Bacteroides sp.]|uniref:hypothetical protein n=1 Tax=uncultured Bacteroides sp. TaxID=162156 RepID=UPI002628DCE4|nr:hypothetical protein [uncultured Bacteroides sp.]
MPEHRLKVENTKDGIEVLLVENEHIDERVIVEAEEREEFLMPWIKKLIRMEKQEEAFGTMRIATLLNRCARFRKEKNRKGFLSVESINNEIIKFRREITKEKKGKRKRDKGE